MGKSSKKSDVKVAAVPAKKGKRGAEEALEKQATAKKRKKDVEVVVPKKNFEKKSKKTAFVPPPKKKVETSSSEDETSSESEEEKTAISNKKSATVVSKKKPESSSSSSESDSDKEDVNKVVQKANVDESSDESDEEPHKNKLKVQTPAPTVGKSNVKAAKKDNSSDEDEDEDDSTEESSDEETPKAQQSKKILAPVAGKSNPKVPSVESSDEEPSKAEEQNKKPTKVSSETSSSDESSDEEIEDERPMKTPKKTTFGLSMKHALQMLRTYYIQVPNELAREDPAQIPPAEDNVTIEEHETITSPIVGMDVTPATEDEPNPLAILPATPAADSTMEPSASNYARVPEYIPMSISSMAVSAALDSEPINVSSRGSTHVPQFAMTPSTKVMFDYFSAMLIKQFYTILEVSVKMIFKSKRLTFEDVKKSLTSSLEGIPSTTRAEQIASLWQLLADVERDINEWTLLQRSNVSILVEQEYQTVRDKVEHARANFNAAEQLHLENMQKLEAEQEIMGARAELLAIQESSLAQEIAKLEEMLERVKAQYTDVEGQRQALNEEELQLQHSLNEEHAKLAKIRDEYASLVPLTDEDIQNQVIAQAEQKREARLKLLTEKIQGLTQYPF